MKEDGSWRNQISRSRSKPEPVNPATAPQSLIARPPTPITCGFSVTSCWHLVDDSGNRTGTLTTHATGKAGTRALDSIQPIAGRVTKDC